MGKYLISRRELNLIMSQQVLNRGTEFCIFCFNDINAMLFLLFLYDQNVVLSES